MYLTSIFNSTGGIERYCPRVSYKKLTIMEGSLHTQTEITPFLKSIPKVVLGIQK